MDNVTVNNNPDLETIYNHLNILITIHNTYKSIHTHTEEVFSVIMRTQI